MYSYTIDAMAKMIAEKLSTAYEGFSGDKRMCSDLMKHIEATLSEFWGNKIAVVWETEDVLNVAENMGREITEEQAKNILYYIFNHHDTNLGITWTTLECAIEDYLKDNDVKHEESCAKVVDYLFPEYDQD